MLNQLLKLKRSHSKKKPLEDFTTEVLAGLLKMEPEIKKAFIEEVLKLPAKVGEVEQHYTIRTQVHYALEGDKNCIVDMVFESMDVLCFVENKVNSFEGWRQLERYGKALEKFHAGKEPHLVYCTKFYDPKDNEEINKSKEINDNKETNAPKENKDLNFKTTRWYKIAQFLRKYQAEKPFVNEFITFLKSKKMAQELVFVKADIDAMQSMRNVASIASEYLNRLKDDFDKCFKHKYSSISLKDKRDFTQLTRYNRIIYYMENVLEGKGWSELKYGFQLGTPNIYVGIWVDQKNFQHDKFRKEMEDFIKISGNDSVDDRTLKFEIGKSEYGTSIELKSDLASFLKSGEEAESEIMAWFRVAFKEFLELIEATNNQLKWNIKRPPSKGNPKNKNTASPQTGK